jgi:hypothetical protein
MSTKPSPHDGTPDGTAVPEAPGAASLVWLTLA